MKTQAASSTQKRPTLDKTARESLQKIVLYEKEKDLTGRLVTDATIVRASVNLLWLLIQNSGKTMNELIAEQQSLSAS